MADSFLETAIARVRLASDEPASSPKYPDATLIRDFIEPAWANVFNEIVLTDSTRIILRHQVDIVEDTRFYQLPPNVARVLAVFQLDSNGRVKADFLPYSMYNPLGKNWSLNGNTLELDPPPNKALTIHIFYIPNADVRLHLGQGTPQGTDNDEFVFAATPTLGTRDTRNNSYAGCMLRILDDGSGVSQDRVIESYDAVTRTATVRIPFDPVVLSPTDGVQYEVTPPFALPLQDVVAMRAILKLLAYKNGQVAKYEALANEYRAGLRTVRNNLSNMEARVGRRFEMDTTENRDPYHWQIALAGHLGV